MLFGLQPNFSSNQSAKHERPAKPEKKIKSNLHNYEEKKVRKRVLRRVHREQQNSMSSYSSIESEWVSVLSIAKPELVSPDEDPIGEVEDVINSQNAEQQEQPVPLTPDQKHKIDIPAHTPPTNILHGRSDAFTAAISNKGNSSPR